MQSLDALKQEIVRIHPRSDQEQFPILDLLGNLRDFADTQPDGAALQSFCAEAWERLIGIIEANRSFHEEFDDSEVVRLNDMFRQIELMSGAEDNFPDLQHVNAIGFLMQHKS